MKLNIYEYLNNLRTLYELSSFSQCRIRGLGLGVIKI
jgi:hypothetical protein